MIELEEYIPKTAKHAPITHIAIAAHKDDGEMLALHGILNCYDKGGFALIVLTDGGNCPKSGKYADVSYDDMAELRTEEQKRAATFGKYEKVYFLQLPSSSLETEFEEISSKVASIFNENPTIQYAYAHSLFDRHKTHINASKIAIESIRQSKYKGKIKMLYGVELWRDLDWIPENEQILLDVSGSKDFAMDLLSFFPSQNQSKMYNKGFCGRVVANATFSNSHSNSLASEQIRAIDMTKLVFADKNAVRAFVDEQLGKFKQEILSSF